MLTALTLMFSQNFHWSGLFCVSSHWNAVVTVVGPSMSPLPGWWSLWNTLSIHSVLVAEKGLSDTLLFLQKMVLYLAPLHIPSWHLRLEKICLQTNRRNFLSFQSVGIQTFPANCVMSGLFQTQWFWFSLLTEMWLSVPDKVTSNLEESQSPYRPVFDNGTKDDFGC